LGGDETREIEFIVRSLSAALADKNPPHQRRSRTTSRDFREGAGDKRSNGASAESPLSRYLPENKKCRVQKESLRGRQKLLIKEKKKKKEKKTVPERCRPGSRDLGRKNARELRSLKRCRSRPGRRAVRITVEWALGGTKSLETSSRGREEKKKKGYAW